MRLTRIEFVERWKHDFAGFYLEALCKNPQGAELALLVKSIQDKVEKRLGQLYDDLSPIKEQLKEVNGKLPVPVPVKK